MRKFTITESEREEIRGLYEQATQQPNPSTNLVNEVIINMSKGISVFKPQSVKNTIVTIEPTIEYNSGGNRVGSHSFRFLEHVLNGKTIRESGVDVMINAEQIESNIDPKTLLSLMNSKKVTISRINQPTFYGEYTYPIFYHTLIKRYKLQPQQASDLFESVMPGSTKVLYSQLSNVQYEANSPEEKALWDKYIALIKPMVGV